MRCLLAVLGDRFLNWLAPPIDLLDVLNDPLTEWEQTNEVFEPDELWAATNLPADHGGTTGNPPIPGPPTGTDGQASATGAGGLPNP